MTSGIHLAAVVVAADQFWPHLTAILHWHRHAGPVQRLSILHLEKAGPPGGPAATAALLERVVRTACPGVRIERREAGSSPDAIRNQLAAWHKDAPDQSWIFQLPGACSTAAWGLDDLLLLPGCRVIQRLPSGDWLELRRAAPGAGIEAETLPAFRREESDELAIVDLVRAQTADTPSPSPLAATPAKPLPLVPLTAAAMTAAWDWKQAFANAVPEFAAEPAAVLFVRYLGALVLDLGLKNVVQGSRRARSNTPATAPAEPLLWIHHGGRLVVIDARLESTTVSAESDASSSTTLPPLAADILRAVEERRDLGGLTPDWLLFRPCHALQPVEKHLADALGIKVIDETGCRDLPARLAAHFGLPLSPDAVEIERRLRTHLAESGRTRAFAPESALLQQQRSTAPDPVVVHTDGLLDQVQRARGQNWLLWIHNERVHLRVPSEGRASASGDWRAMLAAFVGLDPALVQSRQTQRVVLIDFPETPEHRRRVADWLRPFLNAALTFDTARARFAAEARVTAEAEAAARANARPGTGPSPAAASPHASPIGAGQQRSARPAQTSTPSPAPAPKPAQPRPAAPPAPPAPRRMQRVSLEDLDRALDSAFTPPPSPDPGPAKK
jgi:hypothetical protein